VLYPDVTRAGILCRRDDGCVGSSDGLGFCAEFFGGANLVSSETLVRTACAVGARAPIPESKARKLEFYKRWDKESFAEELEMLKVAVADQAYHFQLHKVHVRNLRVQHQSVPKPWNLKILPIHSLCS
jgi:hypothetical protein